MRIGIIGCGNLGLSILKGIVANDDSSQIIVSRRNLDSIKQFESNRVEATSDNRYLIENSDILIITLKPYTIVPFLKEHKTFVTEKHTIVSAATGITIEEINNELDIELGVYRIMPNTASSVGESMTTYCTEDSDENRIAAIETILKNIGQVVRIQEDLMESATILGACGVAYVLRFMRAMIQGGIEVGFDAATATKIVSQTMKGAAELIIKNDTHPEEEIDKVTTPKGCTIVGLNEMEHAGFSSALIKGIVTSYTKIEK